MRDCCSAVPFPRAVCCGGIACSCWSQLVHSFGSLVHVQLAISPPPALSLSDAAHASALSPAPLPCFCVAAAAAASRIPPIIPHNRARLRAAAATSAAAELRLSAAHSHALRRRTPPPLCVRSCAEQPRTALAAPPQRAAAVSPFPLVKFPFSLLPRASLAACRLRRLHLHQVRRWQRRLLHQLLLALDLDLDSLPPPRQ